MDMRNRWATGDGVEERGIWEPPAPPHASEPLSTVLYGLLEAAAKALDVDPEQSRVLLHRASTLLQSREGAGGLTVRPPARAALAPWLAKRVARHIDDNLERSLPLGELAKVAGLSNSYFSRAFKGAFGETPHAFILRRRVARARAEMLESEEPLSQIALACGFADQAHLARIFRRETGSSPSVWRVAHRPAADPTVRRGVAEAMAATLRLADARAARRASGVTSDERPDLAI